MTTPIPSILLVGGGRMGSAMLRGWRERGLAPSIVLDPAREAAALAGPEVGVVASADAIAPDFRPAAIVLAVKPQLAGVALPPVAPFVNGAVVLSIMAGRTLGRLAEALPGARLVRAMPNTPAAIGQGMSVACAGHDVSGSERHLCDLLLGAVGDVAWVDDESLLDAVTAVSGSGPAYAFLLAELLEQAGMEQGLPPDLARRLARATLSGAGALLATGDDPAMLRRAVTSPGGTTQAALAVLMAETAWPALISKAVAAAADRSRELAG